MFAFLYLTEETPNIASLNKLIKTKHNIYIHAKYPAKVLPEYKKYIIPQYVQTKWGDYSIVKATIALLREALQNPDNKYFVLCSGDSYFIKDKKYLDNFSAKLSIFNFVRPLSATFYKTSQWFLLTRKDAETICNTANKYRTLRYGGKGGVAAAAPDEYYFLSVLHREATTAAAYKYKNKMTTFVDNSFDETPVKHPYIFNKLTTVDYDNIHHDTTTMFYRKILNPTNYIPKLLRTTKKNSTRTLYFLFIGTETPQKSLLSWIHGKDYIILTPHEDLKEIRHEILENTIGIYKIIFKFYKQYVVEICKNKRDFLKQWDSVVFVDENGEEPELSDKL